MFEWINRKEALKMVSRLVINKGMNVRHSIIVTMCLEKFCKNPYEMSVRTYERFEEDVLRQIRYQKNGIEII